MIFTNIVMKDVIYTNFKVQTYFMQSVLCKFNKKKKTCEVIIIRKPSLIMTFIIVSLILIIIPVISTHITATIIEDEEPLVIKILNYNIKDSGINNPEFLDVLKEENADIIMLDETNNWGLECDKILNEVLLELNNYFPNEDPYRGKTFRWCDETIISRFPIKDTQLIETLFFDDGSEYIFYRDPVHSIISVREMDIHFIGVHFKCCEGSYEETSRENYMEGIINYMDELGAVPIIYLGDFNCMSPVDIGDLAPNIGNLGTGPIEMLLNETNPHASSVHTWIDSFRELNPYDPGYSYIDETYESRIDYIFVNQFFTEKLINSTVGDTASAEVGSDHFAVDLWLNMDPTLVNLRFPSQVSGLDGLILSPTEINLSWIPCAEENILHYIIFRDRIRIANATNNHFIDDSLIPKQNYRFEVCAVCADSYKGLNSNHIFINTSYGVVTKTITPTLSGTSGNTHANLTWNVPDLILPAIWEFNIYELTENTSGYDNISLIAKVSSAERKFDIDDLTNGQQYSFIVTAVSELGESMMSNKVNLIPLAQVTTTDNPTTTNPTTTSNTPGYDFISTIIMISILLTKYQLRRKTQK